MKKEIIKLLFDTGKMDLSLRKGSGEDLLDLARRNQLYDFIVTHCLREDWMDQTSYSYILEYSREDSTQTYKQI